MKRKWYWSGEQHTFGQIISSESFPNNHDFNWHGPFHTFNAAKLDAISYFKCDVNEARRCIQEIKQVKKEDCL